MATQRLTASDITSKIATGTPMGRNELLPDVPEGMSARGFYGQFPGGASAYSQAPFKRSSDATDTFDPTEEEATADTSSTETQMENVLSSSLDTSVRDESNTSEGMGESSSLDNIALAIPNELFNWEEIKEDYNNFDTIEKIEEVLKNGKNNIIAAANKGVNEFLGEINALGKEIATITEEGPLNYIGRHITDSIDSVIGIISDPFSKISINTSLTYIGKSVGSNLLSGLFTSLGFGLASTPLGMITVAALSGVDLEEGQKGRHFDNSTQENPNTIAGYNSEGVAVNADGEPGMIDGMFAFKSIGDWMENIGKSFSEIEEDAKDSKLAATDTYGDNPFNPFSLQFVDEEQNTGLMPERLNPYDVKPVGFITPKQNYIVKELSKIDTFGTPGWQTDALTEGLGREWDVQNPIANKAAADKEAAESGLPTSTPIGEAIGKIDFDMGSKVNKDGSIEYDEGSQDQLGGWDGGFGAGASGVQGAGSYDYGGQDDQSYGDDSGGDGGDSGGDSGGDGGSGEGGSDGSDAGAGA